MSQTSKETNESLPSSPLLFLISSPSAPFSPQLQQINNCSNCPQINIIELMYSQSIQIMHLNYLTQLYNYQHISQISIMVLGILWIRSFIKDSFRYFRYMVHQRSPRSFFITFGISYSTLYVFRDSFAHFAYRDLQKINKKKTIQRQFQLKSFATDQTFTTMDNQQIKLKQFQDQFVILIKSSNPEKLNKISKMFAELKNYQCTNFVILDDFKDESIINSEVANNAYFVTSTLKTTLLDDSVYLLYPEDEELLYEQKIMDNVQGLAKQMRLKMNKKLDQKYKKSINFAILKDQKQQ